MFWEDRPRFDLRLKALCCRRLFPAPARFSPRHRHGTRSDVFVRVTVLPLEAVLTPAQLAGIVAKQADPASWTPEGVLGLFTPMTDTGTQQVPPPQADFFELGSSVSFDGRLPQLTLRLGRAHDEIVLDHSFEWPDRKRRLEHRARLDPPGTAEALATIEADSWACPHCHQPMGLRTVVIAPATLGVLESLRRSARGRRSSVSSRPWPEAGGRDGPGGGRLACTGNSLGPLASRSVPVQASKTRE